VKDLEYSKKMCVEETGEGKINLQHTKPSEKDLKYVLRSVDNYKDNEQKPKDICVWIFLAWQP
jgi:hypothetical protein